MIDLGKQCVLFVVFAVLLAGCSKMPKSPNVLFEVPVGYRGFLRIVEDPNGGAVAAKNGQIVVRFSLDGIARQRSMDFLYRYFKGTARYSDGVEIEFRAVEEDSLAETVLWLLPKAAVPEVYFFLGSRDEVSKFLTEHPEIYRR